MIGNATKATDFVVFEKTKPTRRLTFMVQPSDPTLDPVPFDWTAVTEIEFYVKNNVKDADAAALFVYRLTTTQITKVEPHTLGKIDIAFQTGHLDTPGRYWHFLRYTSPAGIDVLMHGPFIVKNV